MRLWLLVAVLQLYDEYVFNLAVNTLATNIHFVVRLNVQAINQQTYSIKVFAWYE